MPRNGNMADDGLVLDFARHVRNRLTPLETRMTSAEVEIDANKSTTDAQYADALTDATTKANAARSAAVTDANAYTDGKISVLDGEKQDVSSLDAAVAALGVNPATALGAIIGAFVPPIDRPYLSVWRTALRTLPVGPASIVVLGDSMANRGLADVGYGWAERMSFLLGAGGIEDISTASAPLSNGSKVWQAGIGATNSSNYLIQSTITKIGQIDPNLVIHVIGTNDYAANVTPTAFKANLRSRLREVFAVHDACNQVLIHTVGRSDVSGAAYSWDSYGVAMSEVAAEPEFSAKVSYLNVDFEMKVRGTPSPDTQDFISSDNIHLNNRGNRAVSEIICRYLGIPLPTIETETLYGAVAGGEGITVTRALSTIPIPAAPFPRTAHAYAQAYSQITSGTNADLVIAHPSATDVSGRMIPVSGGVTNQLSNRFQIPANTSGNAVLSINLYPAKVNIDSAASLSHFSVTLTAS